jgi:hypothetical protein
VSPFRTGDAVKWNGREDCDTSWTRLAREPWRLDKIETPEKNDRYYRDELRKRDLAEADCLAAERKAAEPDPIAAYNLRFAKEGIELDLADPEMLDSYRQTAWRESGTRDWWVTMVPINQGWRPA